MPTTTRLDGPDDTVITAEQIADDLGLNLHTVRRWFRNGALPGRKVGRGGWHTTLRAYRTYLGALPDPDAYDYTAEQIATDCGVGLRTVRGWFRTEGLPGAKIRAVDERGAQWRTTRAQFNRWYAAYIEHREQAAS